MMAMGDKEMGRLKRRISESPIIYIMIIIIIIMTRMIRSKWLLYQLTKNESCMIDNVDADIL